jgi:hypothetical protein
MIKKTNHKRRETRYTERGPAIVRTASIAFDFFKTTAENIAFGMPGF